MTTLLCTLRAQTLRRPFQFRPVHYINPSKQEFDKIVHNGAADRVVLVDFYANWCGPCNVLTPVLRKVTTEQTTGSGQPLDLLTVDIENEANGGPELATQYQVQALPTVYAFRGGKPLDKFVGALNEAGVRKFTDKL
ncbi:Thioredoxin domain-containing protein [Mycena kentingensis (nom. inval.)]|nr:Thioredoxin domain-containing protein [Mycena kentingensis (nom. inval.)]